jgi:hypothetical protein
LSVATRLARVGGQGRRPAGGIDRGILGRLLSPQQEERDREQRDPERAADVEGGVDEARGEAGLLLGDARQPAIWEATKVAPSGAAQCVIR